MSVSEPMKVRVCSKCGKPLPGDFEHVHGDAGSQTPAKYIEVVPISELREQMDVLALTAPEERTWEALYKEVRQSLAEVQ